MIIVSGHVLVDPDHRDRYVQVFAELVEQARSAPGCLDLAITADSVEPARVNNYERWATQADLDRFRAQADVPDAGIEIRDGAMQEHVVSHSRDPFSAERNASAEGQQRPVVGMYAFTTADPLRLGTFWGELMNLPVMEAGDDLVMLDFDHDVDSQTWMFERAGAHAGDHRIGLDIGIDDDDTWATVADRAEALGAERVSQHEDEGVRWIVMRDPDGHRFRVFAPRPHSIT